MAGIIQEIFTYIMGGNVEKILIIYGIKDRSIHLEHYFWVHIKIYLLNFKKLKVFISFFIDHTK